MLQILERVFPGSVATTAPAPDPLTQAEAALEAAKHQCVEAESALGIPTLSQSIAQERWAAVDAARLKVRECVQALHDLRGRSVSRLQPAPNRS